MPIPQKPQLDAILVQVRQKIATHRWAFVAIGQDNSQAPPVPPFVYTVGLPVAYNHPELIIFGVGADAAQGILRDLVKRIAEGNRCVPDEFADKVVANFPIAFKAVDASRVASFFRAACAIAGSDDFPAVQVVWPDPAGKFPWEKGADPKFAHFQPLLSVSSLH